MPQARAEAMSWLYLQAFAKGLAVIWPVLFAFLLLEVALGAIVGLIEGWGVWDGIYFAFITGLTIGYGDLVPRHALTQVLAVTIGFMGITVTALLAGLSVRAFQLTPHPSN